MASSQIFDIVIIGSGMAGLAAAGVAREVDHSICVLDKGRRIGGRVSTRRADSFTFNHGAQFLTARHKDFITACEAAQMAGALIPWRVAGRDAFCGAPTMRDFPAFLGSGLDVRQQVEITDVTRDDPFVTVHDADGPVARGRQLLVTAPAPQTAHLLDSVAPDLAATARSATYAPCWTGMYGFEDGTLSTISAPTGADSGPVGWACWEAQRPGATTGQAGAALTVQAAPDWSTAELERDAGAIADALLTAYQVMVGTTLPRPAYMAAHRWRYARVIQAAEPDMPRHTADGLIGIAGDWIAGARVEDAFLSGHGAMTRLLGMRTRP